MGSGLFHEHGIVTLIIALLGINGVVYCLAYSAYVRFQNEVCGRSLPGLWDTGNDYLTQESAHIEMLFASDSRMRSGLLGLLWLFRLLVLAIAVAVAAYVAGWDFRLP